MESDKHVKLLWTGGWDSTYRLCELLIYYKIKVEPHYLIDSNRKSLMFELRAQEDIKQSIIKQFPYTKDLLLPTKMVLISDLKPNSKIIESLKKVNESVHLGTQYEWLANYCETYNINNLELGFERDHTSKKNIYIKDLLIEHRFSGIDSFKTDPKKIKHEAFPLFKNFEWPLYEISRQDMIINAKKYKFYDIMHLTWFCHNPILNKPCGFCNPCRDVVHYGFSYRLPLISLIRYQFRFFTKRYYSTLIKKYAKR